MVVAGAVVSNLFRLALLFGYAAGVSTNASLTLMLGLTPPALAGTFIGVGVWRRPTPEAWPQ